MNALLFSKEKTAELLRIDVIFKSKSLTLSTHAYGNVKNACHWKVENRVFQFIFTCFPLLFLDSRYPLDNEMTLHTYTTYVKGILGQGGTGLLRLSKASNI